MTVRANLYHIMTSHDFMLFTGATLGTFGAFSVLSGWPLMLEPMNPDTLRRLLDVSQIYFQVFSLMEGLLIASIAFLVGGGVVEHVLQQVKTGKGKKRYDVYRRFIRVALFPARVGLIAVVVSLVTVFASWSSSLLAISFSVSTGLVFYLTGALWLMLDGINNVIEADLFLSSPLERDPG